MIAVCAECGYKLLVQFRDSAEMQTTLREVGWICVYINNHWHAVCPACRKELERAKAKAAITSNRSRSDALHIVASVGDPDIGRR